jgi:glutamate-1-semialdehyde 2,1-aminomutase
MGDTVREGVDEAFKGEGVETHTTGVGSLFCTHFGAKPRNAEEAAGVRRQAVEQYAMHLISNGIFSLPGHPGSISTLHTAGDIDALVEQSGRFAKAMQKNRK